MDQGVASLDGFTVAEDSATAEHAAVNKLSRNINKIYQI